MTMTRNCKRPSWRVPSWLTSEFKHASKVKQKLSPRKKSWPYLISLDDNPLLRQREERLARNLGVHRQPRGQARDQISSGITTMRRADQSFPGKLASSFSGCSD